MNFKQHQRLVKAKQLKPVEGACIHCDGWGYTQEESPTFRAGDTIQQGSGCPRCLGDGIDPEWAMTFGVYKPNLEACSFD